MKNLSVKIKGLPFIRKIVEKFNNIELFQHELAQNIEAERAEAALLKDELVRSLNTVREELDQVREEYTRTKGELLTLKSDLLYRYYMLLPRSEYEREIKFWYGSKTGKSLDLENPQTYNEKIQWLKLYDCTPLKTRLADKYAVREYVKEKIGEQYLTPLLGVWDFFDEIDFDSLPDQFVLKANHGCGWNILVKDKHTFDRISAKAKFELWMHLNFAFMNGFELQYRDIVPKIIAEDYLDSFSGDLIDLKAYCFQGRVESILFCCGRQTNLQKVFFDRDWVKLPYSNMHALCEVNVDRPKNLELFIHLAETLAAGFKHVRVDFYLLNDGTLRFGEMTFTPLSGLGEWIPAEQDRILGDLIILPDVKNDSSTCAAK